MRIEIPSGSIVLFCGVTGAGKTTLMKDVERRQGRKTPFGTDNKTFLYHDEEIMNLVGSVSSYITDGDTDAASGALADKIIEIVGNNIFDVVYNGKTLFYDSPFIYAVQIDAFISLVNKVRHEVLPPFMSPPDVNLVIVKFFPSEDQEKSFLKKRYRKLEADYKKAFGKVGLIHARKQRAENFELMHKGRESFRQIVEHRYSDDGADGLTISEYLVVDANEIDILIVP